MKTLKIFAVATLVTTITLTSLTPAWAAHHHHRRHHRHHSDTGAIWGAAVGGTMLGLVAGSMASQPQQAPQPQVVVVQPQATDTGYTQKEFDQKVELERERARRIALEQEIARLRAVSGQ